MRNVFIAFIALLATGCSDLPELKADFFVQGTPNDIPVNRREDVCDFARKVMGMPILLDPNARSMAYEKLGRPQANELFRPLARANNSFRCVCGTPAEKLKAKC